MRMVKQKREDMEGNKQQIGITGTTRYGKCTHEGGLTPVKYTTTHARNIFHIKHSFYLL